MSCNNRRVPAVRLQAELQMSGALMAERGFATQHNRPENAGLWERRK